jgi:hypothetical protein
MLAMRRCTASACALILGCGRVGFEPVADAPAPLPRFVQSNVIYDVGTTSSSLAFGKDTTAGDLIVVTNGSTQTAPATISDSAGNTFMNVIAYKNPDNGSWGHAWYAANISGGPDTVSLTYTGGGNHTIVILEYANVVGFDVTHSLNGTGTAETSGDAITTAANDVLVGFTHFPGGAAWTPDMSYTIRQVSQYDEVVDGMAGPPGPYAVTFTTSSSITWDAHVIAFKPR